MKDFWEARYATAEFAYGTSPNRFFSDSILRIPPGRMLLPGEGEGRNAVYASLKGWEVDAYDQSHNGAVKAVELAGKEGVTINYTVGSLEMQSFRPLYYDAAALIFLHLSPSIRSAVHMRIVEALRPGGWLIMEAFHTSQLKYNTGGPRSVEMLYDRDLLVRDFQGMALLELNEREVELDEGIFHRGKAKVIRLLGRKPKLEFNGTRTEE